MGAVYAGLLLERSDAFCATTPHHQIVRTVCQITSSLGHMMALPTHASSRSSTNDRKISPLKFFPGPAVLARSRSYRRAVKSWHATGPQSGSSLPAEHPRWTYF